jgi:hypothetical protein
VSTFTENGRLSASYGPDGVDLTIQTTETSLTIRLDPYQAHSLGTGLSAWAAGQGVDL